MYLGIDPDMHRTSVGVVDAKGKPIGGWVCKTPDKLTGREALIHQTRAIKDFFAETFPVEWADQMTAWMVEAQELAYTAVQGANPRDIMMLATVAGGALAMCHGMFPNAVCGFPAPAQWKGTRPKAVHQAATYRHFGWNSILVGGKGKKAKEAKYAYPPNPDPFRGLDQILRADWKHLGDALALAVAARKKYLQAHNIAELRAENLARLNAELGA